LCNYGEKVFYGKGPHEILHNNNEEYLEDDGYEKNEENSVQIDEAIDN
jgi:hypothetical protein